MSLILAIISGFLLALTFPETNLFWLAWVALIPLFIALQSVKRWWQALFCGLITGLIFFGGILFWIKIVGLWIGQSYGYLAWSALALFQGLFLALFALLFYFLFQWIKVRIAEKYREYFYVLLAGSLWIVIEWLRAYGPFAVSTGDIAYSQYMALPLIQMVSIFGVYGLSFLIVIVNFVLARTIYLTLGQTSSLKKSSAALTKIWIIISVILCINVFYGYYSLNKQIKDDPKAEKIKVAIFQANVPQEKKLNPKYYARIKDMYLNETKRFLKVQKADLVLWPETIVPQFLLRDRFFIFRLKEMARTHVILGTPTLLGGKIYNSMVLLDPRGQENSIYHKQHLVPFGEYLPFKKILLPMFKDTDFFQNDYSPGARGQEFNTPWGKLACGICFESILPQLIRPQVLNGGELIVIITNDAWFKRSAALEEHMAMSVFRAVENNRYLIQVANTGYTFIVDPKGRFLKRSKIEKQEWLTGEVKFISAKTFYTRYGDIIVYLALIFILTLSYQWILFKRQELKKRRIEKLRKEFS